MGSWLDKGKGTNGMGEFIVWAALVKTQVYD